MKMPFCVAAILAGTLLGGCAAPRPTAPGTSIPVEIRPTAALTVVQAQAVRQADKVVLVRGSLKRPHPVPLPGHVDVLFLGADGTPVGKHTIKLAGIDSKRGDVQEIPFTAEIDLSLPAGARAVVTYHAPPF